MAKTKTSLDGIVPLIIKHIKDLKAIGKHPYKILIHRGLTSEFIWYNIHEKEILGFDHIGKTIKGSIGTLLGIPIVYDPTMLTPEVTVVSKEDEDNLAYMKWIHNRRKDIEPTTRN